MTPPSSFDLPVLLVNVTSSSFSFSFVLLWWMVLLLGGSSCSVHAVGSPEKLLGLNEHGAATSNSFPSAFRAAGASDEARIAGQEAWVDHVAEVDDDANANANADAGVDQITETACGICYEAFTKPEDILACMNEHKVHSACLVKWRMLKGTTHCPYCLEEISIPTIVDARHFYEESTKLVRSWVVNKQEVNVLLLLVKEGYDTQRHFKDIPNLTKVDEDQLQNIHSEWEKAVAEKLSGLSSKFLHDFAILAMYALCDECFILASDQTSFNVNTVKNNNDCLRQALFLQRRNIVDRILRNPQLRIINHLPGGRYGQYTPLHLAIFRGDEEVVRKLLAHPSIDVNARNREFSSPLHHSLFKAISTSNLAISELLWSDPRTDLTKTEVNLREFTAKNPRVHARVLEWLPVDYQPPQTPRLGFQRVKSVLHCATMFYMIFSFAYAVRKLNQLS